MDVASYQVKKRDVGGFAVSYVCPHCAAAITSPLSDAGTTRSCPTCTKSLTVPGKANLDRLKVKEEADRRKAHLALQQELQKAEQAKKQADAEKARATQRGDAEPGVVAAHDRPQGLGKIHCPYCYEAIKENAKKCKSCHEFIDEELRAEAIEQMVARFQPPLKDIFWLVVKFWAVSLLFAGAGFLLYLAFEAVMARMH